MASSSVEDQAAEAAEALDLADAAEQAGDMDGLVAHLSAAVRARTIGGDVPGAAMLCLRLGDVYDLSFGNRVAARPWFRRAVRMLEGLPPCPEQGYAAVAVLGCEVDDPAELLAGAELALERARRFGDAGLEIMALANGGLALVRAGRVDEGMAMADEAVALICGGASQDAGVVGKSVCSFFSACYESADFARVESWSPELRRQGWLGPAPGAQAFLRSHCDSVRGALLASVGQWSEAEEILVRACEEMEQAMPGSVWHPPIALAELRILQGRYHEAEALLLGRDDRLQALVPMARLHLARGDLDLARATALRGLRLIRDDRVRAAALLGVLVEVDLRAGDIDGAGQASARLDERLHGIIYPALLAEAARLRGAVRRAKSDLEGAVAALCEGLEYLGETNAPFLVARLHLALAQVHLNAESNADAEVEGRAAAAALSRLDVTLGQEDLAVLAALGEAETSSPKATECTTATLSRDGSWWSAGCGDTTARLRDTKGLRYVAELVASPGRERHVLDLVDAVEGVATRGEGVDRHRLGDAGPNLDAKAREAYRRKVSELRDEVEDALAASDDERAARTQAELDALVAELASAFGLGGRDRRAASAAERARLNVTRAVRTALNRLEEALPGAGASLDRRIRTGVFCAYEPAPGDDIIWVVQSRVNGKTAR